MKQNIFKSLILFALGFTLLSTAWADKHEKNLSALEAMKRQIVLATADYAVTALLVDRGDNALELAVLKMLPTTIDPQEASVAVSEKVTQETSDFLQERRQFLEKIYDRIPVLHSTEVLEREMQKIVRKFKQAVFQLETLGASIKKMPEDMREMTYSEITRLEAEAIYCLDLAIILAGKSTAGSRSIVEKQAKQAKVTQWVFNGMIFLIPVGLTVAIPEHHWYYAFPEVVAGAFLGAPAANWLFQRRAAKHVVRAVNAQLNHGLAIFSNKMQAAGLVGLPNLAIDKSVDRVDSFKQYADLWLPVGCEKPLADPNFMDAAENQMRFALPDSGNASLIEAESTLEAEQEAMQELEEHLTGPTLQKRR